MGHSQKEKGRSHERIIQEAAAKVREAGLDGVAVAELMQTVGLTHGGFYRHFESRDELVAQAVERALKDGGSAVLAVTHSEAPAAEILGRLIDAYLSEAHRDNLGTSCAVSALVSDVVRGGDRVRAPYTDQVGSYIELLAKLIAPTRNKDRRAKGIAALSSLVGALSLARAVNDPALSREILKASASELKRQLL